MHPATPPARAATARILIPAAAIALATALLLAACGSSSPSGTSAAGGRADQALAFSRCMREHGVKNFPNPEVGPNGEVKMFFRQQVGPGNISPQTLEAAQNACKHFQAALTPKLSPQEKVQREEAVLKFARCMREHGVDLHPSATGGAVRILVHPGQGGLPNPESPAFQAAQKACQGLLPGKGAGPGTTKTGGPQLGVGG
jgi:hypothetical protein